MTATIDYIMLAYLLALCDFTALLNPQQKNDLKIVVETLKNLQDNWQPEVEEFLLAAIQGNAQLNQSYQFYKTKLAQLGEISPNLLPTDEELMQLQRLPSTLPIFIEKKVPAGKTHLTDAEQYIKNVVLSTHQTGQPEEVVKQVSWLQRLKQKLS